MIHRETCEEAKTDGMHPPCIFSVFALFFDVHRNKD